MSLADDADKWVPWFHLIPEKQLFDPNYMFSPMLLGGLWCKMCDGLTHDSEEEHIRKHKLEHRAWKKRKKSEAERAAKERLRAHASEKKRMKELGI